MRHIIRTSAKQDKAKQKDVILWRVLSWALSKWDCWLVTYSSHLCLYALIPHAVRTMYLAVRTSDFLKKKVLSCINWFHKQTYLLNDSVYGYLAVISPIWSVPRMFILKNCQNSSNNWWYHRVKTHWHRKPSTVGISFFLVTQCILIR